MRVFSVIDPNDRIAGGGIVLAVDMTERVRLVLDKEGRLASYRLSRPRRMPSARDESPLVKYFAGRAVQEILGLPVAQFCDRCPAEDDWPQVIYMRHFVGLRAVLGEYVNQSGAADGDSCTVSISCGEDGSTIIEGEIDFGNVIAHVDACKKCRGCRQRMARRHANNKKGPCGPYNAN